FSVQPTVIGPEFLPFIVNASLPATGDINCSDGSGSCPATALGPRGLASRPVPPAARQSPRRRSRKPRGDSSSSALRQQPFPAAFFPQQPSVVERLLPSRSNDARGAISV